MKKEVEIDGHSYRDVSNKNFSCTGSNSFPSKVCIFISLQIVHIRHRGIDPQISILVCLISNMLKDLSLASPNLPWRGLVLLSTTLLTSNNEETYGSQTPHQTYTCMGTNSSKAIARTTKERYSMSLKVFFIHKWRILLKKKEMHCPVYTGSIQHSQMAIEIMKRWPWIL